MIEAEFRCVTSVFDIIEHFSFDYSFQEFVSFVNNPDGTPRYENTMQYAILKKECDMES